jgi:hypothetical protein
VGYRGAGGAPGRTSWQSKPEQNDYISFIGFMVYYLHHLQPPTSFEQFQPSDDIEIENELPTLSPIQSQVVPVPKIVSGDLNSPSPHEETSNDQPLLLLSGYSYGALITTSLPPILASITSQFQNTAGGSSQAEIRSRAAFLGDQQNELMNDHFSSLLANNNTAAVDRAFNSPRPGGVSTSGGVRMGGHEDLRKSSHESHRSRSSFSLDPHVKKSVERARSLAKHPHRRHGSAGSGASPKSPMQEEKGPERSSKVSTAEGQGTLAAIPNPARDLGVAYLLVSPLHGWINSLATMSLFGSTSKRSRPVKDSDTPLPGHDAKFTIDPTLALFGDDDVFVSVNKLRAWATRIQGACERRGSPNFVHREVSGAGHFWHDHEALQILRDEVKVFVSAL